MKDYILMEDNTLIPSRKSVWKEPFAQEVAHFWNQWNGPTMSVAVRTSGSTGIPKVIHIRKDRMLNSALATCKVIDMEFNGKGLLALSATTIAGMMMMVRAEYAHVSLYIVPPSSHPFQYNFGKLTIAPLVPMQVMSSLQVPSEAERMMQVDTLLIGGAPISDELEKRLRLFPNAVYESYGMTETVSHIALRRVNGESPQSAFVPLPGISISTNADEALCVTAPAIIEQPLTTNDRIHLNADGSFQLRGRLDNVVNSGGVKIQLEEVERELEKLLPGIPLAVSSMEHPLLGEALVLIMESSLVPNKEVFNALPRYHKPFGILSVDQLPRVASGKIDRSACRFMVRHAINIVEV